MHSFATPPLRRMSSDARCVSPSLRAVAQFESDRAHGEQSFRQAVDIAMATLDSLADEQQLTSNAYNSMAKRLKLVHDSRDTGLRRAKANVVVNMAAESPSVLLYAPTELDWVSATFVQKIVTERAKKTDIDDDDEFVQQLVGVLLGEGWWHGVDLPSMHVRRGLLTLLEVDAELFGGAVLKYLNNQLGHRDSANIFELSCHTCAHAAHSKQFCAVCAFNDNVHGQMLLAASLNPTRAFHEWLAAGVDAHLHPSLLAKLRCVSAGYCKNATEG